MTDPLHALWQHADADADFSAPGLCETRSTALARTVKRRNLIETVAGGFVGIVCLALTGGAIAVGLWDFALAGATMVAGLAMLLIHLHRNGSDQPAPREASCRDHYRAQLDRQRSLLRSVPRWYLLPLVPGILLFMGAVATRMAGEVGAAEALRGVAMPLGVVIAMFAAIAWLNHRAANRLAAAIAEIDAIA